LDKLSIFIIDRDLIIRVMMVVHVGTKLSQKNFSKN